MIRISFSEEYSLTDRSIKYCSGETGIYLIYSNTSFINYPIKPCRLLYIGMSESAHNSMGKRLRDHLSGQSGNVGISNYAKNGHTSFTYHTFEVLKGCGTNNLFEIESLFLEGFLNTYGCFPICNGQSGHEIVNESTKAVELEIDWSFFE